MRIIVCFCLILVCMLGYLGYVVSQPRQLADQLNTAPGKYTYQVVPGAAARQNFATSRKNISAVSIEYLPERLAPNQTLEFAVLVNDQEVRRVVGQAQDFFSEPRVPDLPGAGWLKFSFAFLHLPAGSKVAFTLHNTSDHAIELPVQRDPAKYLAGELVDPQVPWHGDLGFRTWYQADGLEKVGIDLVDHAHFVWLVLMLALGLAVVSGWQFVEKKLPPLPLLFLFTLALIFTLPVYTNMSAWGVWDWPEVVSHYQAARHSLAAGQVPLWNPYFCGGNPSWGNPQTYWPSLSFIFTLIFGDILGTKVAMTIYIWLGMIGTYMLSRELNMSRSAALLPTVIFMGNGFLAAHLAAGQILWLTVAWIPWVVLFYLRSLKNIWNIVPAVIFYLLIFLEGRVHLVAYVSAFIFLLSIGLLFIQKRKWPVVRSLVVFALLYVSLGAIKLLPTLDFLAGVQGVLEKNDGVPWARLAEVWLRREVALTYHQPWMKLSWHEYASYVGVLPLLLAMAGIAALRRRQGRLASLVAAGVIFLSAATAAAGQSLFDKFPLLDSLRNHGRAMIMVVLSVALLAGAGGQWLVSWLPKSWSGRSLLTCMALFIFADFFLLTSVPLSQVFSQPVMQWSEVPNQFYQAQGRRDIGYHVVKAGLGSRNWCPPQILLWNSEAKIYARGDEEYQGEVYAAGGSVATLQAFTPNHFEVVMASVAPSGDTIFVNQKYAPGWQSPEGEIFPDHGRIAFRVKPGDTGRVIHLRFWPMSFTVGILISLITAILVGALYAHHIIFARR